ncbi:MAG TPA: FG-GAP repeat protein [Acidimicrobiales bacterium]
MTRLEEQLRQLSSAPPVRPRAPMEHIARRARQLTWRRRAVAGVAVIAVAAVAVPLTLTSRGPSKATQLQVEGGIEIAVPRLIATLRVPDQTRSDPVGPSVALSQTTAVVGAPGPGGGRAYLFSASRGGWKQIAVLQGSDASPVDQFGSAVAISGGTVVVGAPGHGGGRAYVFVNERGSWRQVAELKGSGTSTQDQFGTEVAMSGNTVVVTAPGYGQGAGRAYIFSGSGDRWVQAQEIVGSDTTVGDQFGSAVAVSGDSAVVGAASHHYGELYVFDREATGWRQTNELTAAQSLTAASGFGQYLALSTGTLLVTTPGNYDVPSQADNLGPAQILELAPSGWSSPIPLTPGNSASGASFATTVALSGPLALIGGAPGARAYLFERTANGWRFVTEFQGSDTGAFSSTAALYGSTALVAVAGSVYIFKI